MAELLATSVEVNFTRDEIIAGMVDTVVANRVWPFYIRPIILRGYGEVGVNPGYVHLRSGACACRVWSG